MPAALACGGNAPASSGSGTQVTASCEIYNGQAWSPTGSLVTAVTLSQAVVFSNGDVFLAGGATPSGSPTGDSQMYTNGQWTVVAEMITPRYGHEMVLLPSGLGGSRSERNMQDKS